MTTRRPFVGGNWKMNGNLDRAVELARDVAAATAAAAESVDIVIYPPFPHLHAVGEALRGSEVTFGGQDGAAHLEGAHTGQTSPSMIADLGGRSVLVGHSERRHGLGEPDTFLAAKVRAAIEANLQVVLCVGETQVERDAGETDAVVGRQVQAGLEGLSAARLGGLVVAYEPVWAIGTGVTATPEDAQMAHASIRDLLGSLYDGEFAASVRIIYGGSAKPGNAADLFAGPDVDGGLIGGASLSADDFAAICRAAASS